MAGSVIAYPFATIGLKVYVFVAGHGTILVNPIPIPILGIVYFLGTDLLAFFVIMFLFCVPTIDRM